MAIIVLILVRRLCRYVGVAAKYAAQQSRAILRRTALQAIDVTAKDLVRALSEKQNQGCNKNEFVEDDFHKCIEDNDLLSVNQALIQSFVILEKDDL